MPSYPRRRFIALLAAASAASAGLFVLTSLTGCGYPDRIDPVLYEREVSPFQLAEEARLHARDLPGGDGKYFYVQDTHSMEPTLWGGDYIVVAGPRNAERPYSSLRNGEIVTYQATWLPPSFPPATHRLVQKDKHGWILSGDNNPRSESGWRVTEANYLGVVKAIYRIKGVRKR